MLKMPTARLPQASTTAISYEFYIILEGLLTASCVPLIGKKSAFLPSNLAPFSPDSFF